MFHDKTINPQLKAAKENPAFVNFYKKDKQIRRKYYRGLEKGIPLAPLEPNNLVLGVDVGISNIGISLLLDNGDCSYTPLYNEVINFPEYSVEENQNRRKFRSSRRVRRRYKLRRKELIKLLISLNLFEPDFYLYNKPFQYGVKGLTKKLSNGELTSYLLNRNKYRGYQYDLEEIKNDNESGENKKALSKNKKEMEELNFSYPCEMQSYKYNDAENYNSFRGSENFYETSSYIKEVTDVLKNQVSEENVKKIISLIFRRRKFDEGPGNAKSPTPYGSYHYEYVMKVDDNTGEISYERKIVHTPLIEKMKNNCPIYPNKKAIAKNSFINLWFELLNDLNNLTINQNTPRGLTTNEKICIRNHILEEGVNPTFNRIHSWLNELEENQDFPISKEKITGFRIDKKESPIFTDFSVWCKYKQLIINKKISDKFNNVNIYDFIVDILSSYKNVPDRRRKLSSTLSWASIDDIDVLTTLDVSGNGTYSKDAILNIFLSPMENISRMNSEKIMRRDGLGHHDKRRFEDWKALKDIPDLIEEECHFMSPVAKRSTNIAIERINFLREYLDVEFGRIVVETPTDKNSEEERKRIAAEQKENETRNKLLANEVEELGGNPKNPEHLLKMRLYHDQKGYDFYQLDNERLNKINPLSLFTTADYEIDHILPFSKTHDNSYENKILTYRGVNHSKGDTVAYDTMSLKNRNLLKLLHKEILENEKNKPKKDKNGKKTKNLYFVSDEKWKKLLTPATDLNDSNIQRKFTARNLCDTRIIAKTLAKHIDNYYTAKGLENYVHVLTINGKTTAYYRKKAFGEENKNRDCIYNHVVDSYLIALIGTFSNKSNEINAFRYVKKDSKNNKIFFTERRSSKWSKPFNKNQEELFINKIKQDIFLNETIELGNQDTKNKHFDELNYSDKIYVTCLYSKKKKSSISDQTIYSAKKRTYIDEKGNQIEKYQSILKIPNIYDDEGFEKIKKMFLEEKESKLLCFLHNPKLFNFLKKWIFIEEIVNENGELEKIKNPLKYYFEKNGYFKLGNNPAISIHYFGPEYKDINFLNISHKMINCPEDTEVFLKGLVSQKYLLYKNEKGKYKFTSIKYANSLTKPEIIPIKVFYTGQIIIYKNRKFRINCDDTNHKFILYNVVYKNNKESLPLTEYQKFIEEQLTE